ncbi:MAG: DUF4194 domain-containing protein [Akkermansiaceae bacterium]|jgi:hypothetical protein|nr:DUF4194 domain-containing protein [Akkermansiaceae bacterium]
MSTEESSAFVSDAPAGLLGLADSDRDRLAEAMQELLGSGSINGLEPNRAALYHWVRQHDDWVREIAGLSGLDVAVHHEERLIQAVPRAAGLRLRLHQDATLVWLALWYAGDVRWRDEGADQAFLSVSELADLLRDQLLPDLARLITRGRLREILRQAAKLNLIRLTVAEPFEDSGIEVMPAIRRVLPFRELAQWQETAAKFKPEGIDPEDLEADLAADEDGTGEL